MNKPQRKQQSSKKPQKSKKILIISLTACIAVILLAVILAQVGFFSMVGGFFVPRGEVKVGSIPITDGLKDVKTIPKGEVRYRLNKTVTFEDGYKQGDIMLEDPKACEFDMQFTFYTMDSKLIYTSPILKPGEYIFKDKLKTKLKKGKYECVYKVQAFKSDGIIAGETGGYLTITVKN